MQDLEQFSDTSKLGIVLLNMGGPKTLDDIRSFLYELFADPDIINLPRLLRPFQKQFAWLVAKFRTPGTTQMYEQIGNGSPILGITERLGEKISQSFDIQNTEVSSHVVMRYTPPRANTVVKQLKEKEVDTVVLFSQYPHYAEATTSSSLKDFYQAMEEINYSPRKVIEIDEWGTELEYINWWVNGIKHVIEEHSITLEPSTHLIFSAHGLPQRYIDNGETYPERIKEAAQLILDNLGDISTKITTHISFQSQAGPVEWTKPYTDELLTKISERDNQTVIIVPLGFVSNHVETLYEIDILYKEEAEKNGLTNYYRVEVPDDDQSFAEDMIALINRRLEEI